MSQLQRVPDSPELARGARAMPPNVSRLVVVRDPPAAFPAIRPPKTPLLDQALAEEKAREAAAKKPHLFHLERVHDVDSMKHVSRTWCLLCDGPTLVSGLPVAFFVHPSSPPAPDEGP